MKFKVNDIVRKCTDEGFPIEGTLGWVRYVYNHGAIDVRLDGGGFESISPANHWELIASNAPVDTSDTITLSANIQITHEDLSETLLVNKDTSYLFKDIIFKTDREAESVLNYLKSACIDYGQVSVADMYDIAGMESMFLDTKYGWIASDLRQVRIRITRKGYLLDLPKARLLKKGGE